MHLTLLWLFCNPLSPSLLTLYMPTWSHHLTFLLSIAFFFLLALISFSIYTSTIPTCFHVPPSRSSASMYGRIHTYSINRYVETRTITTRIVWYSMQHTLYHHTIYAQLYMTKFLFLLLTFLRSVAIMSWASLDVGFLGEGPVEIHSTFFFSKSHLFVLSLIGSI
jgi:hypothetical protein